MAYNFNAVPNLRKFGSINFGWYVNNGEFHYGQSKIMTKVAPKSVLNDIFALYVSRDIRFVDGYCVKAWRNTKYNYTVIFITYRTSEDLQIVEFIFENGQHSPRPLIQKYDIMHKDEILEFVDNNKNSVS
jgi:hypothetical protein